MSSIAKGLITDIEAASLLGSARQELAQIEPELATTETDTDVIELHPQAVKLFRRNLEALADILVAKDALPDLELVGTFRSLVESASSFGPVRPGNNTRSISGDIRPVLWGLKCRL